MRRLLLFLFLLAVPGMASAQSWYTLPDAAGDTIRSLTPGQTAYYDFADASTDSVTLNVSRCGSVHIHFDPDEDGTNTGATIIVHQCSEASASTAHCEAIEFSISGVSTTTLDGTSDFKKGIYDIQATHIYVEVTANAGTDDARVTAECRP